MKLIVAVIQDEYVNKVLRDFTKEKIRTTKLSSTGGFLKAGSTTLLIGIEEDEKQKVVDIIRKNTTSVKRTSGNEEIVVGGANLFVLDVDDFVKL